MKGSMQKQAGLVAPGYESLPGDFYVRIEGRFEASHYLISYFPDGSDEPLHGHSWKIEVFLSSSDGSTGSDGISYDFLAARKQLDELLAYLDHAQINDLPEFQGVNPTSENIARWFYAGLKNSVEGSVEDSAGQIREIRIYEGPYNMASFRPA